MIKRIMLIAIVLSFWMLSSCSQKDGGAEEAVVIDYWESVEPTQAVRYDWCFENIEIFEERNPGIKVNMTNTENGDEFLNKISTEMAAGNAPDFFFTWAGKRLEPFVKAGRVEPLDGIIESSTLNDLVNRDNCSLTTFDGSIYAIPMEMQSEVIYYNKALFDRFDLKVPETWEELKTAIGVFNENGIIPFSLGNKDAWVGSIPYMAIYQKLNGEEYRKTVFEHKAVFTDESYREAARYLQELVELGAYADNFNTLDSSEGLSAFVSGKAAMRMNGSWEFVDLLASDMGDDLGIMNWVTMPEGKGKAGEGWLTTQGNAYAISSKSENKEAAAKLLEFLLSGERQKVLLSQGYVSAIKVDTEGMDLDPRFRTMFEISQSKNPMVIWDNLLGLSIGNEFNITTKALLGGAVIDDALENLNNIASFEWE